ncbi:MAG: Ldh family oxidoreductase [Myxococcota bacterium]|nr:Ldh family oxidoreductase [Myxococcota bacterium]
MKPHRPQIPTELVLCEMPHIGLMHEVRCAECGRCSRDNKVQKDDLEEFVTVVMMRHGAPRTEAEIVARNLVAADLRGVASHGVARLGRYVQGIEAGYIKPGVQMEVAEPIGPIGIVDARDGLGQVAGDIGMKLAIRKAKEHGVGIVTVRNSNHYGIAGYYVQQAVSQGLLGISMTNAAPLVIPTFGAQALLGTNPIAFGVPSDKGPAFLLDMATSVVPRGKLEVYDRNTKQMPMGWAVDENGYDCQNPGHVLRNLVQRAGGGILPLGGRGEEFSGHKGYGLAAMVDILCGVLSGSAFGPQVDDVHGSTAHGKAQKPNVGHFFAALDIARFMPEPTFRARMDSFVEMLKSSPKALDASTIFIHGEKEHLRTQLHLQGGIPLATNVLDALRTIADRCGAPHPVTLADRQARQTSERIDTSQETT